jgi:hypothetical protein
MTFIDAYYEVFTHAAEGVDVDRIYYDLGYDNDYIDDSARLAVALVIVNSGCLQDPVSSEAIAALRTASRNLIEHGQVEKASPEAAAESMDRMRHCI